MTTLVEPKKAIMTILNTVGTTVYQARPEVIEVFPCITFEVSNNAPQYTLEKEIGKQDIDVTIHIWGKTSKETGSLLTTLETKMRNSNYTLLGSSDLVDTEGYSHLVTRFTY